MDLGVCSASVPFDKIFLVSAGPNISGFVLYWTLSTLVCTSVSNSTLIFAIICVWLVIILVRYIFITVVFCS